MTRLPLAALLTSLLACGPVAGAADAAYTTDASLKDTTVVGRDADDNGVRDDIDGFIAARLTASGDATVKAELVGYARALQRTLTASDASAGQAVLDRLSALSRVTPEWEALAGEVRALTVNTRARLQAFTSFVASARGATTVLPDASSNTRSLTDCLANCTLILFQNGIFTTEESALRDARALQTLIGPSFDGQTLLYAVNYNPTDGLGDLAEVFLQKFGEHALSTSNFMRSLGEAGLVERFATDLLTRKLQAAIPPVTPGNVLNFLRNPTSVLPSAQQLVPSQADVKALLEQYKTAYLDVLTRSLKNLHDKSSDSTYTDAKVASLVETLDDALRKGMRVVLVPYSQGNLYATVVYRELKARGTPLDRLRIVGVAVPGASIPGGEYVTSQSDLVVSGVRLLFDVLPPTNASVPMLLSQDMGLGHNFGMVYANPKLGVSADVRAAVQRALRGVNP